MNSFRMNKLFVCVLLILPMLGCGSNDGRVTVSGVIELDGKGIEGATVAFIGGNGGALATAFTDKDGKFTIKAASGSNKVAISKDDPNTVVVPTTPPRDEDMLMGTADQVAKQNANKPKNLIPVKYTNPDTSGLKFEISSGMAPIQIALASK